MNICEATKKALEENKCIREKRNSWIYRSWLQLGG